MSSQGQKRVLIGCALFVLLVTVGVALAALILVLQKNQNSSSNPNSSSCASGIGCYKHCQSFVWALGPAGTGGQQVNETGGMAIGNGQNNGPFNLAGPGTTPILALQQMAIAVPKTGLLTNLRVTLTAYAVGSEPQVGRVSIYQATCADPNFVETTLLVRQEDITFTASSACLLNTLDSVNVSEGDQISLFLRTESGQIIVSQCSASADLYFN